MADSPKLAQYDAIILKSVFLNKKRKKKDKKIRIHSLIKDCLQVPGIRRNTKKYSLTIWAWEFSSHLKGPTRSTSEVSGNNRLPTSGNSDWLICPLHQLLRAAITNYHKLRCLIYRLPFLEATSGGQRADSELLAELISSWRFRGRVHSTPLSQFLVK